MDEDAGAQKVTSLAAGRLGIGTHISNYLFHCDMVAPLLSGKLHLARFYRYRQLHALPLFIHKALSRFSQIKLCDYLFALTCQAKSSNLRVGIRGRRR